MAMVEDSGVDTPSFTTGKNPPANMIELLRCDKYDNTFDEYFRDRLYDPRHTRAISDYGVVIIESTLEGQLPLLKECFKVFHSRMFGRNWHDPHFVHIAADRTLVLFSSVRSYDNQHACDYAGIRAKMMPLPKQRRTGWDFLFGRNKHLPW